MNHRIISSKIVQKPDTFDNKFHKNTEKTRNWAYRSTKIDKTLENSSYQIKSEKIYAFMTRMYSNAEIPRRYLGDRSQMTNWILDSGATFHMTP